MNEHRLLWPVNIMARVLEVSRSGFYVWLKRKPSELDLRDITLKALILTAHKRSRETYGTLRIKAELAAQSHHVGRDHISRLRKELKLVCKQRRKFTATTNSKHNFPVAPNLLDQKFDISEPGMVWGTDITYIPTDEGWLYLAGVKDFGSREIVGFAMDKRMTQELTQEALRKALSFRKPLVGCIHHSDRGSQYCAHEYQADVKTAGLIASMSRKGNCYCVYGLPTFIEACESVGLKPILGTELVYEDGRAVLIAESDRGFSRITRLLTERAAGPFDARAAILTELEGLSVISDDIALLESGKGCGGLFAIVSPTNKPSWRQLKD